MPKAIQRNTANNILSKSRKIIHTNVWKDFFWSKLKNGGKTWRQIAISSSLHTKGSLRSVSPLPAIKTASLAGCVLSRGGDTVLLTLHFGPFRHSHSPHLANKMDTLSPAWQSQGFGVREHSNSTPFISMGGSKNCVCKLSWNGSASLL